MSKVVMVGSKSTKEAHILVFSGGTSEEIAGKVALVMAGRGYRLESGNRDQAVYGRGSAAAHAMLGPLARRQKYNITIVPEGDNVAVVIAKGMTGMGGGLLSASKVKRELQAIIEGLQETLLA